MIAVFSMNRDRIVSWIPCSVSKDRPQVMVSGTPAAVARSDAPKYSDS